ncbi:CGNR zinc finger domain-containing protein [Streptomyces sp. SAJ15]|uniref:CGNR zinc finger domain-containing protein n=1 Tax=Streptomyces sp. SAJ15 TaxID=2011095 RepID=UPI001186863B
MTQPTLKQCETCGGTFEDRHRAQIRRFCSPRCKGRAAARRRTGSTAQDRPKVTSCLTCAELLIGRCSSTRYCNEACWRRWRDREKRGAPTQDST